MSSSYDLTLVFVTQIPIGLIDLGNQENNSELNTVLNGPENFDKGLVVVKTGIPEDCD
jgi:hypothetical protein